MWHINSLTCCFGILNIFFNFVTICTAYEAYFPLSTVHLTIPQNDDAIEIFQTTSIVQFSAESLQSLDLFKEDTTGNNDIKFHYEIYNENEFLSINETNGEIWIGDKFKEIKMSTTSIISAIRVVNGTFFDGTTAARMTLTINPLPISNLNEFCKSIEKICFWDSVLYTVVENNSNLMLGSIGPIKYRKICPQYDIKYRLLNATTFFTIKSNILYTTTRFDHDSMNPGPSTAANVQCQITERNNGIVQIAEKLLQISVLDKNDNPPQLQTNELVTIKINDPHFHQNEEVGNRAIMFSDSDSLGVNNRIGYEILNDTLDMLKPECKAYEADHQGLRASAINCKLLFSRSGILRKSPYCVELTASDPTVEVLNRRTYKTAIAKICITADLSKIHEQEKPAAQALQSGTETMRRRNRKNRKYIYSSEETSSSSDESSSKSTHKLPIVVTYPRDAIVYKKAKNLTRLTEPTNLKELLTDPVPMFRIAEDRTNAFGITSIGGIVYIKNTTALQYAQEMIYYVYIAWLNELTSIVVHLEDIHPNSTCTTDRFIGACAEMSSKKDCQNNCAIGTDGGSCQWRSNNLTGVLTINYATCVPNLAYCPNYICDPLEELGQKTEQFICPQDCASSIFGPHTSNDGGRGIRAGSGLCTCDEFGKCSCGPHEITSPRIKKNRELISTNTKYGRNQPFVIQKACGLSCQILVILCPLALVLIMIIVLMYRRQNRQKNPKSFGKNGPFDDGKRETETDAFNDIPLVPVNSEFTFKAEGDPKWEFPKTQLVLDVTLGEGEFGKVIKGYATNIQDKPGITTVAVKMLKNSANSVELLALLSEFQLLQEVCHPNVIRLLGACTQESPMIIIEYAKHGSLRNYLRLSRKLECHGIEFTDGVEPITVKDVLSFAWQICKGMTYLTEIKLVHRDLAARNVLLTEGKVCKISDFGLTRDVYEDDAYLKRSKDRVPVKWMAPESLADHVYTTRSDVWAFGILCWELITLGASPYPGIPPQNLYHLLKTGYRMERPENCSDSIYDIIKSCWADDPYNRPPFKLLASQWETLLGNNSKYLTIESNAISNPLYCTDGDNLDNCRTPSFSDQTNIIIEELKEADKLEHLWHPPYTATSDKSVSLHQDSTNDMPDNMVLLSYDVPRPLIEAKTVEQNLRYQNDLTMPMNVKNLDTTSSRTSHPNVLAMNGTQHYDTPIKRRKSYMDMSGGGSRISYSNGYNLDVRNEEKKKISKDITFRFSSLLNLNEQI